MLLTDRRRALAMREHEADPNPLQGALFAPDALTPARGPTPDPFAPPRREPPAPEDSEPADAEPTNLVAPSEKLPAPDDTDAPAGLVSAPDGTEEPTGLVSAPDGTEEPAGLVSAPDETEEPADFVPDSATGFVAPDDLDAPTDFVAAPDDVDLPVQTTPRPADAAPRRRAAALAGPTLDDVVTRVWEGMRAQVPTPCPVCRTEIEPAMDGHCGSCGSALD